MVPPPTLDREQHHRIEKALLSSWVFSYRLYPSALSPAPIGNQREG